MLGSLLLRLAYACGSQNTLDFLYRVGPNWPLGSVVATKLVAEVHQVEGETDGLDGFFAHSIHIGQKPAIV
jgi:hypothetical protein